VRGDLAIPAIFVSGAGFALLGMFIVWMYLQAHPRRRRFQVRRPVAPVERPAVAAVRSPAVAAPAGRAAITGRQVLAGEVIASSEKVER
jgi:hypothetical protein